MKVRLKFQLVARRRLLTVFTHQNILWLQIAVDDLLGVKMSNAKSHLHGEEFDLVL